MALSTARLSLSALSSLLHSVVPAAVLSIFTSGVLSMNFPCDSLLGRPLDLPAQVDSRIASSSAIRFFLSEISSNGPSW
ncbi:hypothetical protein M758_UG217600 [Ceratodon purpureus]|nr:hypothetical protein M758_UG217600 [Ceratodon purpureus]